MQTDETERESRPSLPMCCRGCRRCARQVGRALCCPIDGTRFSATPPEPRDPVPATPTAPKGDPAA